MRIGLALAMIVIATVAASAQGAPPPGAPLGGPMPFPGYQGTPDDQKACQPAVFKFCQAAVPDTFRILQCLQQNRSRIGRACQQVLANYGQ